MPHSPPPVEEGAIVQITNAEHRWYGALVCVTELKPWGCMGFAPIPANDGSGTGHAYIRLQAADYEAVGRAVLMPASGDD